jgi:hypothetical protein
MIAYKVLRKGGGILGKRCRGLFSSNMNIPWQFKKTYRKGVVNRPLKGSKLFVFQSLTSAQKFANDNYSLEIWEVEVPDNVEKRPYIEGGYSLNHFSNFWNNNAYDPHLANGTPRGTLLVDGVKLIKKL